jgi:hypothetical protein
MSRTLLEGKRGTYKNHTSEKTNNITLQARGAYNALTINVQYLEDNVYFQFLSKKYKVQSISFKILL